MSRKIAVLIIAMATVSLAQKYTPHWFQQNDWFLEYGENTAQYVNPASIAENDQIEITGAIFQTLNAEAGQEYVSFVHPFHYNHSLGFTFFENGAPLDESPGTPLIEYIENAYQLGYAYRLGPALPFSHSVSVGVNVSMLQFDFFSIQRSFQFGADLGLSINPIFSSRFGHVQFGLAMQNVLQPQIIDPNNNSIYKVPRNLNASAFWRTLNRKLELSASGSVIDVTSDHGDPQILPSVRATYYITPMIGLKAKYNKQGYPVVGGTINVKHINIFRYFQLDVDLSHDQFSSQRKDRGIAYNVRLVTRVGPTREERIGAARYRRLKLEPEDAYREAMRLYLARKFLLASYAFGKVITKYPAFHLVDQAAYYKGKSFENIRMHNAAREVYQEAIKRYDMSDVKPRYIFQLMNIDYKEGKYPDASERYQLIANLYKETDVKPDADYVMGQIRFIEEDYASSVRLLQPILPGNANYVYARYTLAMSFFRQKKEKEAIECLKDIMTVSPSNISEQELQDISAVKLGHFAFDAEPPRLLEAAKFYSQVPPNSSKYDESLLGLSWSFLRANKYKEAFKASQDLITSVPNSFLVGEAYLLKGYCEFFEKNYQASVASFDKAIELSNAVVISESEIDKRKSNNQGVQGEFEEVQKSALLLSNQIPSARVLQKRDELRPQVEKVQEQIESFIEFMHRVEKSNRFLKNKERVIRDAQFTKATVKNYMQNQDEKKGPSVKELEELELKE